jgi:hypothetical protein
LNRPEQSPDLRILHGEDGQRDDQNRQQRVSERRAPPRSARLWPRLFTHIQSKIAVWLRLLGEAEQLEVIVKGAIEKLLLFFAGGEDGAEQSLEVLRSASPADLIEQPLQAQMVIHADGEPLAAQMRQEIAERERGRI